MSRYCLDTSAYARFQRGSESVVRLFDRAAWIGVPAPVLGELRVGFGIARTGREDAAILEEFLAQPVVEELPVDGEVARHYADILIDLRQAGTPIPTNDLWIAACAARAGAPVLTFDGHFSRIARVGAIVLATP